MSKILDFTELLVTKLFHDIAGTIGAINNGFELLEDRSISSIEPKVLELIKSNSSEASHSLIFFRYLYGKSKQNGQGDMLELKELLSNFFSYRKVNINLKYDLTVQEEVKLTHKHLKLIANLCLISSTSLIQGGEIDLEIKNIKTGLLIKLIAKNHRVKVPDEISEILENHELCNISLMNVQIHYAAKIATSMGAVIKCEIENNNFAIIVTLDS